MGGRSPFVKPRLVRLNLADVRRRAYETLQQQTIFPGTTIPRKATSAELEAARAAIADAEADGYYIDVKAELNAGELREVFSDMVLAGGFVIGEKPVLDATKVGISKVMQYLKGWNLADENGPVEVSRAALDNLEQTVYSDIVAAVDWHEEQSDKARAARKNDQGTERESPATSPSLVGAIGGSSGSAN